MAKCRWMVFLVLFPCSIVYSQEEQVPLDEEGKIQVLESDVRQKAGLFTEYENFVEARLYRQAEDQYFLEIAYQQDGKRLKKRIPMSSTEVQSMRSKITQAIRLSVPETLHDQDGRTQLIITSTVTSLLFYGPAVPAILDVNDTKLGVGLYMLTATAGILIPFNATKHRNVTDASATLYRYGTTRGIIHGFLLDAAIFGDDNGVRRRLTLMTMASIGEAVAGYHYATISKMTPGTSEVISTVGDFGMGFGIGSSVLINKEDKLRPASTLTFIGSGVGMVAGKYLASTQTYTRGDAYVLQGAGYLGAYVPIALVRLAKPNGPKPYVAAAMLGSLTGLGIGNHMVKDKNFTTGQGTLVELGGLAGYLFGLGVAYLLTPKNENNQRVYLMSSAIGATGGFWFMYKSFVSTASSLDNHSELHININPIGLAMMGLDQHKSNWITPIVHAQLTF